MWRRGRGGERVGREGKTRRGERMQERMERRGARLSRKRDSE